MWHWPSERGSGTGVLLVFLGEEGTEKGAPPWNFVCVYLFEERSISQFDHDDDADDEE